jgi:cyclic beta-1,2-glucan synthetase
VEHEQRSKGASNVTVRNVITSMRLISDIDWADLFESVSLVDERLRSASDFAALDFPTRNLYRSAIEQLADGSPPSEIEIADHALNASHMAAAGAVDAVEFERVADPGYHLIAEGRRALERTIGFCPPPGLRINRFIIRLGIGGYVGAILFFATGLLLLAIWALAIPGLAAG